LRKGLELPEKDLIDIFKLMEKQEVLLEINRKYGVPSEKWIRIAKKYNVGTIKGSDVHCIEDLEGEREWIFRLSHKLNQKEKQVITEI
jgi:histidinol phosphatase-like PHP family hydrolase